MFATKQEDTKYNYYQLASTNDKNDTNCRWNQRMHPEEGSEYYQDSLNFVERVMHETKNEVIEGESIRCVCSAKKNSHARRHDA